MFKDEDQDGFVADEGAQVKQAAAAPRPRMDEESEMDDEDLLGKSTLAKIVGKPDDSDDEDGSNVEDELDEDKPSKKDKKDEDLE